MFMFPWTLGVPMITRLGELIPRGLDFLALAPTRLYHAPRFLTGAELRRKNFGLSQRTVTARDRPIAILGDLTFTHSLFLSSLHLILLPIYRLPREYRQHVWYLRLSQVRCPHHHQPHQFHSLTRHVLIALQPP
jgi:hypothetical protein